MGDLVDATLKLGAAISNGSVGLLAFSVALNIYLIYELRSSQRAWVEDLKSVLDRDDKRNAAQAAAIEVVQALSQRIATPRRGG